MERKIKLKGTLADKTRQLFACIRRGKFFVARDLLKSDKVDLAARSERNLSFLQEACMPNFSYPVHKDDQYSIIELLIQAGVDCRRSADQEPWTTPLLLMTSMMLRLEGDKEADTDEDASQFWQNVERFLNAGAEIGGTTRDGKNIMHLLCSARWRTKADTRERLFDTTEQIMIRFRPEIASRIIERGPKGLLDAQDSNGRTPLHVLCERKLMDGELLKFLLSNNVKVVIRDEDGRTPFDYRVMHDDMKGCRQLFDSDQDEDQIGKNAIFRAALGLSEFTTIERYLNDSDFKMNEDELLCMADDKSFLHNACSGPPSEAMLRLALRLIDLGANANARDHMYQTPLLCCCKDKGEKKMQVIKELVRRGADANAMGQQCETPLYYVLREGESDRLARYLVKKANADVNLKAGPGKKIPLFYAKTLSLVKLLLENGADAKIRDSSWNTLLHDKKVPIVTWEYLLERKAIPVDVQNDRGETPLFVFCRIFREHSTFSSEDHKIRKLLQSGANPYIEDDDGWTPFMALCACPSLCFEPVRDTILYFASRFGKRILNHESSIGITPLVASLNSGYPMLQRFGRAADVLEFLVENGADIFRKTKKTGEDISAAVDKHEYLESGNRDRIKAYIKGKFAERRAQIHGLITFLGERDWFSRKEFKSIKRSCSDNDPHASA